MRLTLPILLLTSMTLLVIACSMPVTRGHIHEAEAVKAIKIGVTSKDEVQKLLGSPSSESSFGLMTWYYISGVKNVRSLLKPEITEQNVTEIAFDGSGVVSSIKEYTLADGKKIDIAKRVTATEGQQLGFFEQIMGNLGRFNKEGSGSPRRKTPGVPGR
jgi:outer membrane protein assembly factor BamE (lipoprotein component of BamABCDE complex)